MNMAAYGEIDDVIDPADSRRWIATLFDEHAPALVGARRARSARTSTPGRPRRHGGIGLARRRARAAGRPLANAENGGIIRVEAVTGRPSGMDLERDAGPLRISSRAGIHLELDRSR